MAARHWRILAAGMLLLAGRCPAAFAEPLSAAGTSAAGTWQQIDDKTGGVGALIVIREEGGRWNGYITKIYPDPGDPPNPVCSNCRGSLKDRPVLGMQLMRGLHRNGAVYDGGTIVDPTDGTVQCHDDGLAGREPPQCPRFRRRGLVGPHAGVETARRPQARTILTDRLVTGARPARHCGSWPAAPTSSSEDRPGLLARSRRRRRTAGRSEWRIGSAPSRIS